MIRRKVIWCYLNLKRKMTSSYDKKFLLHQWIISIFKVFNLNWSYILRHSYVPVDELQLGWNFPSFETNDFNIFSTTASSSWSESESDELELELESSILACRSSSPKFSLINASYAILGEKQNIYVG